MEEPDQGLAEIERETGSPLTAEEKDWLEIERRCAMLRLPGTGKQKTGIFAGIREGRVATGGA